jgi:hypothetical protein
MPMQARRGFFASMCERIADLSNDAQRTLSTCGVNTSLSGTLFF